MVLSHHMAKQNWALLSLPCLDLHTTKPLNVASDVAMVTLNVYCGNGRGRACHCWCVEYLTHRCWANETDKRFWCIAGSKVAIENTRLGWVWEVALKLSSGQTSTNSDSLKTA